jgi:hypothetical protein
MIRKLATLSVLLFAFSGIAQTAPITITFNNQGATSEDMDPKFFPMSNWQTMSSRDVEDPDYEYSGFKSMAETLGVDWVAQNTMQDQYSDGIFYTTATPGTYDGLPFDLHGLWLASAYGTRTLVVGGLDLKTNTTFVKEIVITTTAEYHKFDWSGISMFYIDSRTFNDYEKDDRVSSNFQWWLVGGMTVTLVPEPETYAMLLAGLGVVGVLARRRRKKTAM